MAGSKRLLHLKVWPVDMDQMHDLTNTNILVVGGLTFV